MTNDSFKLISLQLKFEKEEGLPLSLSVSHTKLHISWRGSCTQIHTICPQLLGDRECSFASLRHLLTLIDRLTQTMCVGESPQRRGRWANTRPSVSGGEWLLTCRDPFQEKSGQNDNIKNLIHRPFRSMSQNLCPNTLPFKICGHGVPESYVFISFYMRGSPVSLLAPCPAYRRHYVVVCWSKLKPRGQDFYLHPYLN